MLCGQTRLLAVSGDQPDKGRSGQARWEKAEESVGPERITEGKEWSHREDVTQD